MTNECKTAYEAKRDRVTTGWLIQDACNPKAVARELVRMIDACCEENGGTGGSIHDNGVALVLAKLCDMHRIDVDWIDGPVARAKDSALERLPT